MKSVLDAQNLREILLSDKEEDTDLVDRSGDCFEMNWAKDHWVVRFNRKRVRTITPDDVSKGTDLRDDEFILNALSALKNGGMEALDNFLEGA